MQSIPFNMNTYEEQRYERFSETIDEYFNTEEHLSEKECYEVFRRDAERALEELKTYHAKFGLYAAYAMEQLAKQDEE
jgi:hypothetical protein